MNSWSRSLASTPAISSASSTRSGTRLRCFVTIVVPSSNRLTAVVGGSACARANEHDRHRAGSVALVSPGVSGAVLNDTVALSKVDLFRVELEPDFPGQHADEIDAGRAMHSVRGRFHIGGSPGKVLLE